MITIDEEGRFNDVDRELRGKEAWTIRAHSLGTIGISDVRGEGRIGKIEAGRYVPDEINVQTCLSCTRARCTGGCKKIVRRKKKEA